MKKMLFKMLPLVCLMVAFVSCKPNQGGGGNNPDEEKLEGKGTEMKLLSADNLGNLYSTTANTNIYRAVFTTGDVAKSGKKYTGTGQLITIEVSSLVNSTMPKIDTYVVPEPDNKYSNVYNDGTMAIYSESGGKQRGSYIESYEDGVLQTTFTQVQVGSKATFKKSGNKYLVQLDIIDQKGEKSQYYYIGALAYNYEEIVAGEEFSKEPTKTVTQNAINFTKCSVTSVTDDALYCDVVTIELANASIKAQIEMYVPYQTRASKTRIIARSPYPVSTVNQDNIVFASLGYDSKTNTHRPTVVMTGAMGNFTTPYYIQSGNMSFDDSKISINFTSVNGSKFVGEYSGEWSIALK